MGGTMLLMRSTPRWVTGIGTMALLAATVLISPVGAGVAWAADPPPVPQQAALAVQGPDFVPLTPEQLQMVGMKEVAAARLAATSAISPNACPVGPVSGGTPATTTCPYGYLGTYTRQQSKSYYCGPAAVQVVANYAWGIFNSSTGGTTTANNKYTQQYISTTWTNTDNDLQTYVWRVRYGLNGAAAGHMPPNFVYKEEQPTGGADWHAKLRTDVTTYAMPMVAGVAPHDPDALYYLTSWAQTKVYTGHYIVLNGWYAYWDGTRNPTVNYNDGSAGYGGGTGAYSDRAFDVYYTITKSNPLHAPNWVVW